MYIAEIYDGEELEVCLAGSIVEPGRYRNIETGRSIYLSKCDRLPASLDGRVACYQRIDPAPQQSILRSEPANRR